MHPPWRHGVGTRMLADLAGRMEASNFAESMGTSSRGDGDRKVVRVVVTKEEIRSSGKQAFPLNNTALKSIRDTHEDPPGHPTVRSVELFDHESFQIKTLRRGKGMDYSLVDPEQPWSWRRMLNAFGDDTLQKIVGDGITNISCKPIPGSYDHKRRHAAKVLGKAYPEDSPVPVWDFEVERVDGTRVWFHTSQTNKKVEIREATFDYEREGPRAGKGNSDGKGTYKRMLANTYNQTGSCATESALAEASSSTDDPGALKENESVANDGWWDNAWWWSTESWGSTEWSTRGDRTRSARGAGRPLVEQRCQCVIRGQRPGVHLALGEPAPWSWRFFR